MTHQPALLLDTVLLDRALAEGIQAAIEPYVTINQRLAEAYQGAVAAHADCSNLSHAEAARIVEEAREMREARDALRALAKLALAALRATLTTRGHLAQRVQHEGLGYCGHRSESERCAEQRALIAALEQALETEP